jgi:hypothetical protein
MDMAEEVELVELVDNDEPVRIILMALGCAWDGMLEVAEV